MSYPSKHPATSLGITQGGADSDIAFVLRSLEVS